jgi:homoserine dehydrogenase
MPAPVILVTYATTEDAVRRALAKIEQDGVLAEKPQLIRIEKS